MIKFINIVLLCFLACTASGQFTMSGKIEYERHMSLKRLYSDLAANSKDNDWYDRMKNQVPQYMNAYFDMYFTTSKTLYKPGKKADQGTNKWWGTTISDDDVVLSDFSKDSLISFKNISDDKYLIEDTLRKIKWKIRDEIRTIANFKCRKAVGLLWDSVYVVAFYTEDIPVSGGPHMFSGLPGMILELAIPRLYTTWTAVNIDATPPKETELAMAKARGKKLNNKQMGQTLSDALKDWGEWGARYMWWGLL